MPPKRLEAADLAFFRLRWSEAWTTASFGRLAARWDLAQDSPFFLENRRWMRSHRRLPYASFQKSLQTALGTHLARYPLMAFALLEIALNRLTIRTARRAPSP